MFTDSIHTESIVRIRFSSEIALAPDSYHLLFILSANGSFQYKGKDYAFEPNDSFLFFSSPTAVFLHTFKGKPIAVLITFTCQNAFLAHALTSMDCRISMDKALGNALMHTLLYDCVTESKLLNDSVNYHVISFLYYAVKNSAAEQKRAFSAQYSTNSSMNHLIAQVTAYIDEHLSEDIPLDAIAKILNCSVQQVNTFFQKHFGGSYQHYLRSIRLKKAKELLCCSDYSITSISEQCGFSSIHYFSRYFKKMEKMPPLDYRNKNSVNDYVFHSE